MAVSEEERRRFEAQVKSLQEIETDDPGTPEQRRRIADLGNALRAADGRAPLPDEDEEPPELEFYRKAKALGMVRTRRRDPG